MDNPREEKVAIVTEVKERLQESSAVVVTEYRGLTVAALAELRRALRPAGGSYKVYKNTLVRRAASDAGVELEEHLVGPTALAFTEQTPDGGDGDVVTVAKVLRDFAKTNPELVIKGGLMDGQPIDADEVKALADVEPREVLLAKLAGLMAAPMQQFAGLLQALPRDFAYGLQALIDKGGSGEAPAADAATDSADSAEEPASDDAPAAQTEEPAEEPAAEATADEAADETADAAEDAATETEQDDTPEENTEDEES